MNTRLLLVVLVLFSFAGLLAKPAFADIITNGDFGTGTLDGWTVFTTANGSNGAGLPDVVSFNTTGSGATDSAQFQVGEVGTNTQQGGGLDQTIDIGTEGEYDFSAAIAAQDVGRNNNAQAGTFSLIIDGSTIATEDLGAIDVGQTIRATLDGTANLSPGLHVLELEITRSYLSETNLTPYEYVTDITSTDVSAVPEPTSLLLLGTVVVLVGLILRRKFAASQSVR